MWLPNCAITFYPLHIQSNVAIGSAGFAAQCAAVNYQAVGQELPALHCNPFCVEPHLTPPDGLLSYIIPFPEYARPFPVCMSVKVE